MEHLIVLAAVLVLVERDAFPIQNPVVPFPLQDKPMLIIKYSQHSYLYIPNASAENLQFSLEAKNFYVCVDIHSPVYLHWYGATANLSSVFHWTSSYSV